MTVAIPMTGMNAVVPIEAGVIVAGSGCAAAILNIPSARINPFAFTAALTVSEIAALLIAM